MNLGISSLLTLMILVGMPSCWQDFLMLRLIIIFETSSQLVCLK